MTDAGWQTGHGLGRSSSYRVAAWVREHIIVCTLPAGQFLCTECLADQLGVSATPVREALMILQGEGAVR